MRIVLRKQGFAMLLVGVLLLSSWVIFSQKEPGAAALGPLPPTYNNIGISDDSNPLSANFDGASNSYSAQALAAVGATPGATIIVRGIHFTWPAALSGTVDNWQAEGQTINFGSSTTASVLGFLGSAHFGPSIGTGTITYSDGTTQNFHLGFSDWTLNGGTSTPAFGNLEVLSMAYRNSKGGQDNALTYVFYTQVTLHTNGVRSIASITFPASTNQGKLHVFAIGTYTPATPTPTPSVSPSPGTTPPPIASPSPTLG